MYRSRLKLRKLNVQSMVAEKIFINENLTARRVVSLAAVFWAVTQRSTQEKRLGGALRDSPKNGCEGDYEEGGFIQESSRQEPLQ